MAPLLCRYPGCTRVRTGWYAYCEAHVAEILHPKCGHEEDGAGVPDAR